jgi:rubrerythrin
VIDAQSAEAIREIAYQEGRSILQYVGDAFPWTAADQTSSLDRFQQIVHAERDMLARLTQFLYKQRVAPPAVGSYPVAFTSLNFVSLGLIVKRLIEYEQKSMDALQATIPSVVNSEARALLQSFLDLKKKHLQTLKDIQAGPKPSTEPAVMT